MQEQSNSRNSCGLQGFKQKILYHNGTTDFDTPGLGPNPATAGSECWQGAILGFTSSPSISAELIEIWKAVVGLGVLHVVFQVPSLKM